MEWINRMRKDKKGFTLVEIIVVLVILAILAAFTIPAMLGFVNDAKKKAAIAEQREVYVAAQAIVTENYAKGTKANLGITSGTVANIGSAAIVTLNPTDSKFDETKLTDAQKVTYAMYKYLGNDITAGAGAANDNTSAWAVKVDDATGKVTEVTYTKDGITLDPLKPSSNLN